MNNNASSLCQAIDDAQFGPAVSSQCRGAFDFTLYFEQLVLIAIPGAVLLVAAPFRVYRLKKAPVLVRPSWLRNTKLVTVAVLGSLQLALVCLWAVHGTGSAHLDRVSIAAASVSVASSIACCAVSYYEHAKSLRPSSLLNVFLLVSLVLDCAVTRTLWMSSLPVAIQISFSVALATKTILVILEAQGKQESFMVDPQTMPPEETAGLYSRVVLAWVLPLLRAGFGKLLRPSDLFALDDKMTAQLLSEKFKRAWKSSSSVTKHRLIWTCAVALKGSASAVVLPRLVQLGFTICQPLALTRFLSFLGNQNDSDNVGYGLTAAYGIIYFGIALSQALYWHYNARSVSMLRSVLVTSVFSKMTTLYTTESEKAAAVTLMSSDVDVIVRAAREIHELWANIIQIAIGTWLLAREVGYAAVGPILVSGIALGATLKISPMARNAMVAWLQKTQKRVGITSAMIGHMKSIKMSGLATTLANSISALRREEIDASKPFRIFGSLTSSVAQIPILLSPVAAFGIFQAITAQTGAQMDAQKLFTALALITLQAQPLFWMFELILDLTVAKGAFHRIETFLLREERPDGRQLAATAGRVDFDLANVSLGWTGGECQIANATFEILTGQLAMIVGPTASGKSTLLKEFLGEVPHVFGDLQTTDRRVRVSFCDQTTWAMNQSIRENIVGYAQFEEDLYNLIVDACELRQDLLSLKDGDNTVVGSNGIALSGGQKQRLAMARALYHRPEIALFDDVLSALDNKTVSAVAAKVFGPQGLLRRWNTTTILVTHTAAILPLSDVIISLADRSVAEFGTFVTLSQAGGYVQNLTVAAEESSTAPFVEIINDLREEDKTNEQPSAVAASTRESSDKRRQRGDPAVYKYYGRSIGLKALTTLLLLEVGWAFLQSFPTVWLNFWNDSIIRNENRAGYYLGIYAALQTVAVIWFALLIWFVLVQVAARSGIHLHSNLLKAVVNAPFSVFVKSDIGSITTRFSQDIGILDNQLPLALVVSLASFFTVLARTGLLAASSYYVAIAFPFLAVAYYYLQRSYLRTSRQLRMLDLEQKSPIYTQFLETASGLATIRAFNWAPAAVQKNYELVDESQKPFYLLIIVQKWLVLALDMMTAALALLVVGFAVYLRGSVSVGLTGVSLVQLISMSETLTMLIQFWTSIETSIGAVARIKNFAEETGDENSASETGAVPPNWPQTGAISISHISASYDIDNATKALEDVSIDIKAGEKVALCGRTGSGKSSLLLAVLRLLETSQGCIRIDGIDLATISRNTVRTRLITVSQDQFVLPGSIKHNLNPEGTSTPDSILEALRKVGLSETVEAKGGLDVEMKEDTFSHGQRQLLFLTRAVLKKDFRKVVLLDEASSNLDSATAERTRDIVATEFAQHTVISIAHRLDTIMDYDRVVVLEKGVVVEVGSPRELLESATHFRDLYRGRHS